MRSSLFRLLPIVTAGLVTIAPTGVAACEGVCISGVTNAWIGNYSAIIDNVLHVCANKLASEFLRPGDSIPLMAIMDPISSAYHAAAYKTYSDAIFPGYFHGKCQREDPENPKGPPVDPAGCPNPDCPVVCGTPGSMVHFYSKLTHIVFTNTEELLRNITHPKSKPALAVVKTMLEQVGGQNQRRSWIGRRGAQRVNEKMIQAGVEKVLGEILEELAKACGGSKCSWEKEMKEFILSFP